MNNLRQLYLTALLVFALAFSAYAGNIECGVVDPPPPPQPAATASGEMLQPIVEALAVAVLSLP